MPDEKPRPNMTGAISEDLQMLIDWLGDAENSIPETTYRENAIEDYKFYAGDQDTDAVKEALEQAGRPTSVYNEVKPKIDMMVGMAAESRKMPEVLPVGAEDEPLAELINGTVVHYHKKLNVSRLELDCFEHTCKSGRSLLYFYVDKSNPYKPVLKARRYPGTSFYLDPNSQEYDMSDARYLFLENWITEDDFRILFPNADPEIIKEGDSGYYTGDKATFFNAERERYRLLEAWYYKHKELYWFINPMTEQPDSLTPKEFKKFVKMLHAGLQVGEEGELFQYDEDIPYTRTFVKQYYFKVFCGTEVLAEGEAPHTHWTGFPAVLYAAYKDEDKNAWFSAIAMMKDPQRAMNTMMRQLSHLLQTLPKGILVHEVGAILNMDDYEENSSSPNFHLEVAKGAIAKYKFEQQPQISPVYQQFYGIMRETMKNASGAQDDLMGIQKSSRDPVGTVRQRRETGLAVLFLLYDNFRMSRHITAKLLLAFIQQYVTLPQIIRIEGENGRILSEINSQLNPQSTGLNDVTAGEFDVELDEITETPTARMAVSELLIEYSHNNPDAIPPDVIIDYMGLPFTVKQRIKEYHLQQQQAAQEAAEFEREMQRKELEVKVISAKKKATTKN
jgi:hypothetical protein